MPETNTQITTGGQSSNVDSSRHSASSGRPWLRWPLAVLLMVVVAAGLLKLYTDWEVSRLEQEQQQSQQELQRQASIQKLLVGTLSADRIEADESDFETLTVNGRATIEELMSSTADIEDLRAGNLTAVGGNFDTLLIKGARIANDFQVNGNTTLADLLLQGQLRLTGNTEDMVLLEPENTGQSVFSVRTPSGEETASLNARGDLRLSGGADIGGVLRVSRNAVFNADVLIKGGLLVQKSAQLQDSLAVEEDTTLSGSLTVKDSTRLQGSLSVQGPLEVGEDATFKSDVRMEQNQDVQGQLTAGTAVSTGISDLQGSIFNTTSNNQGRVYVDDDFEVTGTMYGTDLVLSGSVTQGDTTVNNLTVLGTADFLGPVTMSDELTIGPNTLYADPVNNRVGIGTDTPSQLLHVAGNALVDNGLTVSGSASITNNLDIGGSLTVSGSGAFAGTVSGADAAANDEFVTLGQINDGGDTSTSAFVQGGNSFGALATLGTNDANGLAFETGGAEQIRIDTTGNVGIGTVSPAYTLDVNGDARIQGNDLHFGSGESLSAGDKGLTVYSDSGFIDLRPADRVHGLVIRNKDSSSSAWSGIRTPGDGRMELRADDASYKQLQLRDSGDVTMHDGNLGIGTSLPAEGLTLGRDGTHRNLLLSRENTATDTTQYPSNDLTLQGSVWDSTNSVAENRQITLKTIAGSGTNGSEPYRLAVRNNAGNEFVSFDGNNRRVGIGTTTPDGIFTVNGYQGGTYGFTMRHKGSATTFRGASSATEGSYFHIEHRGSNETSIKGSELYVDNVVRINGKGGLGLATASGGGHYKMNMVVDGASSLFLDGSNNSRFVGIGTTSPGARLQVNTKGGGKVGQIIKGADSQSADLLQAKDSNGNVLASIDAVGNLSVKDATVNGTLTVNGVAVVDGVRTSISTKTADYTLTDSDSIILADASGGAVTVTLPSAVGREGREFTVKKIDGSTNNVTVATDGSETIDGSSSHAISSEDHFLQVVSNGSNWFVLGIAPSL